MAKHRIPRSNVTKRILEKAKKLNWSTYQLSDKTDISIGVFERWKKGEHDLTLSTLEVVADAFGTTPDKLLKEGEEDPVNTDPRRDRVDAIFDGLDELGKIAALVYLEFLNSEKKKHDRN